MRSKVAALLIGIMASVTGAYVLIYARQSKCVAAGGTWNAVARLCALPGEVDPRAASIGLVSYAAAMVAGIAVAFVMWRIWLFSSGGVRRRAV